MGLEDLPEVHPARHAERVEDHVDRRAVLQERHVLHVDDLRDHALVAVAAGELVALGDLALLGHEHAHQVVDARRQIVTLVAAEGLDVDHDATLTVGHLQRGVADLARLLLEDRADQLLLGRQLGLALRRDLADEQIAGRDLGADPDDPAIVEIAQRLLRAVRDVAGDLLIAQLRRAGVDLVLLDVNRGELVVLHEALGQDDRVLEVVALPGHEGDQQVLAQRHLARVGRRAVGEHVAGGDADADIDDRLLVDQRALVGAHELLQLVLVLTAFAAVDHDLLGVDVGHRARLLARSRRRRCRSPRGAPSRCRSAARRSPAAAPPGAACSSPSARGWRRRAPGTGSSPSRPTRSARARRRSGRPARASPSRTDRPASGTGSRRR